MRFHLTPSLDNASVPDDDNCAERPIRWFVRYGATDGGTGAADVGAWATHWSVFRNEQGPQHLLEFPGLREADKKILEGAWRTYRPTSLKVTPIPGCTIWVKEEEILRG